MLERLSDTYRLIGRIGAGSGGEIYKAYHKNLNKYVVLKKIRSDVKDQINIRTEADMLKNLRHSCLPQVLDFLNVDGNIYTVMDFIPGHSFKEYLDSGNIFPESSVYIWMKQLCSALCYLHSQKPPIIHGDLKPGNIMLMPNGNICLIDFNISLRLDGTLTKPTGYTAGYAAPEQISAFEYTRNNGHAPSKNRIDERTDIYSLGATIYHLLTGRKVRYDRKGQAEDIRKAGAKISDVFAEIIMKCLEVNPSRRYQSCLDLLTDLQNIQKKDSQYKALIRKQRGIYVGTAAAAILFAMLAVAGYFRMTSDRENQYQDIVKLETQAVSDEDYVNSEIYFEEAISLMPNRGEAYYQEALSLYNQKRYEECINFINNQILSNEKLVSATDGMDSIYQLLGEAYEKIADYESAADAYEKAVELSPGDGNYYRDYAIALVNCGRITEAESVLSTAKENGLSSISAEYVQGEIAFRQGNYNEAKEIFENCIENSTDDDIRMRAYLMEAGCIEQLVSGTNGKQQMAELLEEARNSLPKENNIGILEELAQVYSDLGAELADNAYYEKAISVFEQIETQGMSSYDTQYNLAVLYQNIQDYARAAEILSQMLEDYGDNYKTYKSLAFLEVAKQSARNREQRDYAKFEEYYKKAEELYQKQLENNVNDVEMERLEELYEQAVQNGWLS